MEAKTLVPGAVQGSQGSTGVGRRRERSVGVGRGHQRSAGAICFQRCLRDMQGKYIGFTGASVINGWMGTRTHSALSPHYLQSSSRGERAGPIVDPIYPDGMRSTRPGRCNTKGK